MFQQNAPFVGISAQNEGVVTTYAASTARRWLANDEVASVAGTLREQCFAADIDPADTGADAEPGDAAAEELVARADRLGLPWLLRDSGRAGGRHVLVVSAQLGVDEWARWCRAAAERHAVGCTPRRTVRLLSAPHRTGMPSPILAGTLRPEDLPASAAVEGSARTRKASRSRKPRSAQDPAGASEVDRSRREYGDALARARAGWGARRAWRAAAVPGSKAEEIGEPEWRRWVWCRAVTVVAAEHGLSEEKAWSRFQHASRVRARRMGRDGWRSTYWCPAVAEARVERPRRRCVNGPRSAPTDTDSAQADQAEIERIRAGLRAAAEEVLSVFPRRPQFVRSVYAALDALAPAVLRRGGSLAERAWCEAAQLSRSTLRTVLAWLVEHGVVLRERAYRGGTADCSVWALGPRSHAAQIATTETQPTGGTPPPQAPTVGRADPARLRRTHARERQAREEKLSALTEASVPDESSPAAHRAARSLAWQRRWWTSLTPDQQQARREERRTLLGAMHPRRRSAWLRWLEHRSDLATAAERVLAGHAEPGDHPSLAAAPVTVHRGLHAPEWTSSSDTPSPPPLELALAA